MSDVDLNFEEEDIEKSEVVVVDSEDDIPKDEPIEDPKTAELTKEIEELRRQADQAAALKAGVEALGDKLSPRQQPTIEKQPEVDDEDEFEKEFNEKIYGDNPKKVLDKYFERQQRKIPKQSNNEALVYIAKNQMKLDPDKRDFYLKHEKEIDNAILSLPDHQRSDPRAVEWAYKEVSKLHQDEVIDELVNKKLEEKLKEMGYQKSEDKPQFVERGRSVSPPMTKKPTTVYLTKAQLLDADRRGIPESQYARLLKEGKI